MTADEANAVAANYNEVLWACRTCKKPIAMLANSAGLGVMAVKDAQFEAAVPIGGQPRWLTSM